ncbi:MAG: hypothetical protein OXJ37_22675 [Bryobacterales bacterium]|nr:hypothetical protein [Bryobacterales bacterium]MDE0265222.1 hypothetical protein [Bryobacterales bacterium]
MTAFDMLTTTRNLQAAGRGPMHPLRVIVNAMRSAISERVAKKAYLRELEQRLLEVEQRLMNCQSVLLLAGLGLLFAALKLTS